MRARRNETPRHHALKCMALQWCWTRGFKIVGFEVDLGTHICDVVAMRYQPGQPVEVVAIEAKAQRSDWLREANAPTRAEAARQRLKTAEAQQEAILDALYDPTTPPEEKAILGPAARKLRKRIGALRDSIYRMSQDKLTCPVLRAATSQRYLIAPKDVISASEVPEGWGLIRPEPLRVQVRCPKTEVAPDTVLHTMGRIARVQTVAAMTGHGLVRWGTEAEETLGEWPSYAEAIEAAQAAQEAEPLPEEALGLLGRLWEALQDTSRPPPAFLPDTYGDAIALFGLNVIDCEPHEWDNSTARENAVWLGQALRRAILRRRGVERVELELRLDATQLLGGLQLLPDNDCEGRDDGCP